MHESMTRFHQKKGPWIGKWVINDTFNDSSFPRFKQVTSRDVIEFAMPTVQGVENPGFFLVFHRGLPHCGEVWRSTGPWHRPRCCESGFFQFTTDFVYARLFGWGEMTVPWILSWALYALTEFGTMDHIKNVDFVRRFLHMWSNLMMELLSWHFSF